MKILVLLFAALLVAGCGEKSTGDPKIDQALKEAVEFDSLEERDGLYYQTNESEPYSGWVKRMYDSGQVKTLTRHKDGKPDGPFTAWHENGQKMAEATNKDGKKDGPSTEWHENGQKREKGTWKDGKIDGLMTAWHENGQKMGEGTFKDGKEISAKYWNSKGEEVETAEEAE